MIIILIDGLIVFISEYFGWSVLYIPILSDLLLRIWPELIGIGLAVIIIDNANEFLRTREEKKRLILQMGSPDNAFAREAVRQLSSRGWLFDGSVRGEFLGGALSRANLESAILLSANLVGVQLKESNLRGAYLEMANLNKADLSGTNLESAQLHLTNLGNSIMERTNLEDAFMLEANLENASLEEANMNGAFLYKANMNGAYLYKANLERAILARADLRKANMAGAILIKANMNGADLKAAQVILEQLAEAESLEGATMPDGTVFNPETFKENLAKQEPPE